MPSSISCILLAALMVASVAPLSRAAYSIADVTVTTGDDVALCKVLRNDATGENVTIVLNMGGRIEELFLFQGAHLCALCVCMCVYVCVRGVVPPWFGAIGVLFCERA